MAEDVSTTHRLVLVVDDNPDGAESLRMVLGLCGYDAPVAHTGSEGIILARQCQPHAVVCDIGLPDLDGFWVARALRQDPATADVYLIAMTAYGDERTRDRARDSGSTPSWSSPPTPRPCSHSPPDRPGPNAGRIPPRPAPGTGGVGP
jgi:CheY-like chemotaxis protein